MSRFRFFNRSLEESGKRDFRSALVSLDSGCGFLVEEGNVVSLVSVHG